MGGADAEGLPPVLQVPSEDGRSWGAGSTWGLQCLEPGLQGRRLAPALSVKGAGLCGAWLSACLSSVCHLWERTLGEVAREPGGVLSTKQNPLPGSGSLPRRAVLTSPRGDSLPSPWLFVGRSHVNLNWDLCLPLSLSSALVCSDQPWAGRNTGPRGTLPTTAHRLGLCFLFCKRGTWRPSGKSGSW